MLSAFLKNGMICMSSATNTNKLLAQLAAGRLYCIEQLCRIENKAALYNSCFENNMQLVD
jgi:hypothetical protein